MNKLTEQAERYQSMPTDDLLAATGVHRADYQPEALDLMEKELASRNISVDYKDQVVDKIKQQETVRDDQLRGIRGWLIVFLIVFALGSLRWLLEGIAALVEVQSFLQFLLVLPQPVVGGWGLFVLALLMAKKPSAPRHAIRWLITVLAYRLVYGLVTVMSIGGVSSSEAGLLVLSFAGNALWLTYLSSSRRVAVTYSKDNDTQAAK